MVAKKVRRSIEKARVVVDEDAAQHPKTRIHETSLTDRCAAMHCRYPQFDRRANTSAG
jgi:hypothetical protein